MYKAKQVEIRNVLTLGTFKVVLREAVPNNPKVLLGRFVLTFFARKNGDVKFLNIDMIGGHIERVEHLMFHSSVTM